MSRRYWRVGSHFFLLSLLLPHRLLFVPFIIFDSRFEILFSSYFLHLFSLSLFILCESGIIIVQSYPSSLIRPPLLEKCSLHFPSRFYTPTDGCMNLTTVKLLLCLLAASTLWNVNLFSSYYILQVIKVSTPLFTCSFSPFLHRDRWTNNSKKATLRSSWSQFNTENSASVYSFNNPFKCKEVLRKNRMYNKLDRIYLTTFS